MVTVAARSTSLCRSIKNETGNAVAYGIARVPQLGFPIAEAYVQPPLDRSIRQRLPLRHPSGQLRCSHSLPANAVRAIPCSRSFPPFQRLFQAQ